MKKYFLFIIIIAVMMVFDNISLLSATSMIPENIFENMTETDQDICKFKLRKTFRGNFINSGYEEIIGFYYEIFEKKIEDYIDYIYQKIKIYIIKDNKIIKKYNICYEFLLDEYSPYDESIIKSLEPVFGKWNGYYYLYDLNKNGYNEIFIFPQKSGGHVVMTIYEFKNDKFVRLTPSRFDMDTMVGISVKKDDKSFTLKVPYEFEEHKKGHRDKTFKWNEKKGIYEIVKVK